MANRFGIAPLFKCKICGVIWASEVYDVVEDIKSVDLPGHVCAKERFYPAAIREGKVRILSQVGSSEYVGSVLVEVEK